MSSLAEIEAAVPSLSMQELERLKTVLRQAMDEREAQRLPRTTLTEFSGILTLREDPLAWQREVREEWP